MISASDIANWELRTSGAVGLSLSELRFAISFFSSVLVNILLKYAPGGARGRHWFSLITGTLLLYYPFRGGCLLALPPAVATYVFMWSARLRQHCGTLTWLTVFPYLVIK
jgi:hypothetical protein